jgi:hypothetical protein
MKTIKYIKSKLELFKRITIKTIKIEPFNLKNELNHPRFDVDETFDLNKRKGNNSLLFHMYSKENETLFI